MSKYQVIVFPAFLFGAQLKRDNRKKSDKFAVVFLEKSLDGTSPALLNRQAVYPLWWPSLTKDM